jgi:hypothetical protein
MAPDSEALDLKALDLEALDLEALDLEVLDLTALDTVSDFDCGRPKAKWPANSLGCR